MYLAASLTKDAKPKKVKQGTAKVQKPKLKAEQVSLKKDLKKIMPRVAMGQPSAVKAQRAIKKRIAQISQEMKKMTDS